MKRLERAIAEFLGDMARENRSPRSRNDHFRHLVRLFDHLPRDPVTEHVDRNSIRATLDGWADAGPATRYKVDSIFRLFCKWLHLNDHVDRDPMDELPRPKRLHPDDVPLRALSGADARKMFDACSRLRRRHLDLDITWDTRYESNREEATSGFEPLYEALQASA